MRKYCSIYDLPLARVWSRALAKMVGLFLDNQQLMFDIDYARTQSANPTISFELLRVARSVRQ